MYADLDLARCIQPRQMHDITGYYNRFDVFDLRVDRRGLQSSSFVDTPGEVGQILPDLLAAADPHAPATGRP